jgi:hypothetical protein
VLPIEPWPRATRIRRIAQMADLPPPSRQEPNLSPPMNELATQKPIPATPVEPTLWQWLTEPKESLWLLPVTGAWILGLDWILFAENTLSLYLATPVLVVAGFIGGLAGTHFFQTRYAGDRGAKAWIKSLLAGIVVGLPFPLAGTFVGGWILFNSGLAALRERMLRKK